MPAVLKESDKCAGDGRGGCSLHQSHLRGERCWLSWLGGNDQTSASLINLNFPSAHQLNRL